MTESTVRELLDFNYHSPGPMPRALGWYVCIYLWYSLFTTVYKIQIDEDNSITAIGLFRTIKLRAEDIIEIKDQLTSLKVRHRAGSFTVTTLIDGVGNIKTLFHSVKTISSDETDLIASDKSKRSQQTVIKVIIVLLLIGFAAYVEYYDQTSRQMKKHQVTGEATSGKANH